MIFCVIIISSFLLFVFNSCYVLNTYKNIEIKNHILASTLLGIIVSISAFFYMCYIFFKTIILGEPVHGFPTLIIVILFLGGIQLLSLGIIGEYLGRIFIETKNRPVYIINEKEGV